MKNLFANKEFPLDEILFEGRNKSYGAYSLRNEADSVLTKAMFYGLLLFGSFAAAPLVVKNLESHSKITLPKDDGQRVIVNVQDIPEKTQPVQIQAQPKQKTFDSTLPEPHKNATHEKKPATEQQKTNAVSGAENSEGITTNFANTAHTVGRESLSVKLPVKEPVLPIKKTDGGNEIAIKTDVEASFVGGIDSFRKKISEKFDVSEFEGNGEAMQTVITFVVERDGTISNIKANGKDAAFNRAAVQAVQKVNGKWYPGKLQGHFVRSYFSVPLTMRFE